ncbi:MAG: T9SS type A sorting domain-containing protein [Ignavibacteriaceae bacterium]
MKKYLLLLTILIANISFAQWTDNQNAEYVIGQPDFTTYTQGSTIQQFYNPYQCAIDFTNHKLYVADYGNFRVLRFSYPITSSNPTAEMYFGTGTYGYTQNQIGNPGGVAVYNGTLWICDASNNRILKFNNAYSATNSPNADGILGQSSYTTPSSGTSQSQFYNPLNICIDNSGNLWVVDGGNNRILKFNDVNNKANDAIADLVLGQTNFTSGGYSTTQSTLKAPNGVFVYGTTVWVSEAGNERVLRFDNPTTNGVNANGVLGQTDYISNSAGAGNSNFNGPSGVSVDNNGNLYIADQNNHRVMIFNNAANKSNGAAADFVLGQTDFSGTTSNKGQNGFYFPTDATVDPVNGKLLVSDSYDNRIMQFAASTALPVELTSFQAIIESGQVALSWQTATEVNNYGFDIERSQKTEISSQNLSWEKIGFVKGNGNSNSSKSYSFVDESPLSGNVQYRLKQIDNDGAFKYSSIVTVNSLPTRFSLEQNYPNPFNPSTTIKFGLPSDAKVTLEVYNTIGQKVATLVNEQMTAGYHQVEFYASNLASGIYFFRMQTNGFVSIKKLLLLK